MFPFRDLLIALSFTYLYYYQGMKKKEAEPVTGFDNIQKETMIEDDQAILNLSESENQHDSVTHNVDED